MVDEGGRRSGRCPQGIDASAVDACAGARRKNAGESQNSAVRVNVTARRLARDARGAFGSAGKRKRSARRFPMSAESV
jgi:hypothetical protein